MRRFLAASAAAAVIVALAGCTAQGDAAATPAPTPTWIDLDAAAGVGANGNGLWLLDGPTAAGEVVDATRAGGDVTMQLEVHEKVPVEGGDVVDGRTITVERTGSPDRYRAEFTVGDQSGELVVIGADAWMRGNDALAARFGLDGDQFTCVSRQSAGFAELEELVTPADVVRAALVGMEVGVLPPEDGDTQLSLVIGSGGAPVGELTVAAWGAPRPSTLVSADPTGTVRADFAWGESPVVEPPEGAPASCG